MLLDREYQEIPNKHRFVGHDYDENRWFVATPGHPGSADILATFVEDYDFDNSEQLLLVSCQPHNSIFIAYGYSPLYTALTRLVLKATLESKRLKVPFLFFETIVSE
jgi:hypothetical protein